MSDRKRDDDPSVWDSFEQRAWFSSLLQTLADLDRKAARSEGSTVRCVHCRVTMTREAFDRGSGFCLRCAYTMAHYPHMFTNRYKSREGE